MKRWNIYGLVLAVAGVCCIIVATQAALPGDSSQKLQELLGSISMPVTYNQKKANIYSDAIQMNNSFVRDYAILRTKAVDPDGNTLRYVCNLWDDLNSNWVYVNDPPGPDYISSSSESIKANLRGDCEDFSVLMAGVAGSVGAEVRIENVEGTGGNPGHSFAEYYLGDNEEDVIAQCRYISARYDCDVVYYSINGQDGKTAYWLNLDYNLFPDYGLDYYSYGDSSEYHENCHPGQSYYGLGQEAVIYYPDGSYSAHAPGHGYYEEDIFGKEALYEIQP